MTVLHLNGRPDGHRFPLTHLANKLDITLGKVGGHQPGQMPDGLAALAERLGVTHRSARRLHQHGLTWEQADVYAVRAGFSAIAVWRDYDRWAPGEEDLLDLQCRCGPERRPIVDMCDRCGRHIGRRARKAA